jgi:hypothetical protein
MESFEVPKKVASLGVKFMTENGLGMSVLENHEVKEQIRLQLLFSPMYNRITQLNIPAIQNPKEEQPSNLLDMGADKQYDVKLDRDVVIEG